jgi:hypothetical protein
MGVDATFTLVSREQYARLRADPNAIAKSEPRVYFDVGKSWFFFYEVFEEFGEPLSKVFEGDYLPHGLCGGDGHLGYISPELAAAISHELFSLEPEHIFARAAELELTVEPEQERYYRDFFFEMKIGFRVAVRCDGALSVFIG